MTKQTTVIDLFKKPEKLQEDHTIEDKEELMVESPKISPEELNTDLVKPIQKFQKLKDRCITFKDLILTSNKNNTTKVCKRYKFVF